VALAVIVWLVVFPPGKTPPAGDGHGNAQVADPTTPAGGGAPSGQGDDATARSTAGPVVASAALVLSRDDQNRALAPGDRVAPGDALSLSFQANEPLHVYVLDEDAVGEVYVLFPAPGVDLANPLPPGVLHRLPGARAGKDIRWQVTSAGGKETVIVIATREPFTALEQEIARLPKASLDRPVTYAKLGEGVLESLRGIGGMSEAGPASGDAASPKLSETVRRLAASGRPAAPWTWQIELENPK
jgi:hypothetical protein